MGGSPPSAPEIIMPAVTAPTTYKSVVPLESYQQAADYVRRLTEKTQEIAKQTEREVGTPGEIGERAARRRMQESASYLASLPGADKYLEEATGQKDKFEPARAAARIGSTAAAEDYLEAVNRAKEPSATFTYEKPSWAESTIAEGMPGYKAPEPVKTPEQITAEKQEQLKQAKLDQQIRQAQATTPGTRFAQRPAFPPVTNRGFS